MWWNLAAAFLGSCTALFVAIIVYPWQKGLDRESSLLVERRASYAKYISAVYDAWSDLLKAEAHPDVETLRQQAEAAQKRLYFDLVQLGFIGSKGVVDSATRHFYHFDNLASAIEIKAAHNETDPELGDILTLRKKEWEAREDLVRAMSKDAVASADALPITRMMRGSVLGRHSGQDNSRRER